MTDSQKNVGNWPKLEWVKAIRDPIWNYVVITEWEQKLLQTEIFSRLRGIKQLGFAYLSFPGAMHSRFEHSLGVMHVSDQLLKYLTSEEGGISIEKSSHRQLLRIAALLHDIGHAPFSHTIENLLSYYPGLWTEMKGKFSPNLNKYISRGANPDRHEMFTEYLICTNQEIKNILKPWLSSIDEGINKISDIDQENFIRDVIAKLAIGESISNPSLYPEYEELSNIFGKIMSGDIDADKIDYLARDNYYCGLPYSLDINWLRKRIVVRDRSIYLRPEGIKFVIAIVLARYSLFTEVHQDMWDSFTKLKVIETLHEKLTAERPKKRAELIERIFTQMQDSDLLTYIAADEDNSFKKILTTEYSLEEKERLEFADSHPYIRQAMEVIAEHPEYIPGLQENLRQIMNTKDIYIDIRRIKSPSFTNKVVDGDLLRNDILRGISEESLKNLHVVVFGNSANLGWFNYKTLNDAVGNLSQRVEQIDEIVQNLTTVPFKKVLAYLVIQSYRQICQDCARNNEILASDFVLLVMEFIAGISFGGTTKVEVTRQEIYKIAKAVSELCLQDGLKIKGKLDMNEEEITASFYREIRKYEQLGLLTYSRRTKRLPAEDKNKDSNNKKYVFRFDRRFVLSDNGPYYIAEDAGLKPKYRKI